MYQYSCAKWIQYLVLFFRIISLSRYIYFYLFIQQTVQCFHIFLRPSDNYVIFFLQLLLSFHSFSINPFSPINPLIPSAQVSLGLPRFLLPGGRYFITSFGNLPYSILWICPYHWNIYSVIMWYSTECITKSTLLRAMLIYIDFITGTNRNKLCIWWLVH